MRSAKVPGVEVLNEAFFNEFTVKLPKPAAPIVEALAAKGIMAGVPVSRLLPGRPSSRTSRRRGDGDGDGRGYRAFAALETSDEAD